jgi:hypothetical protein
MTDVTSELARFTTDAALEFLSDEFRERVIQSKNSALRAEESCQKIKNLDESIRKIVVPMAILMMVFVLSWTISHIQME